MQQIAIFNYIMCSIDVYTVDSSIDAEEFIINELGWNIEDVCYMTKPDIIEITIHRNE